MFNPALLAIILAGAIQAKPVTLQDKLEAAAREAAIDAAVPSDGEPLPVADRRLYNGTDVCTVLTAAYPDLGMCGGDFRPRRGEWRSIPFVQDGLRISCDWGRCVLKWRQFPPQIHELLITVDGRQALVSGGSVHGGECRFAKTKRSWRKVACFHTWVE